MRPLEDAGKNGRGDSGRFQRHDISGRPRATADQEDRWIVRSAVTALDSSPPFIHACTLSSQTTVMLVSIRQCEDPAFTIVHPTGPQSRVMVWGVIFFYYRTPLVTIEGTLAAQRYVDDILKIALLPFLLQYPGFIFQQDNARRIMPYTVVCVFLLTILQLVKHFLGQLDRQVPLQLSMSGI
ncbi:transposable element Tc1 transposase [Trichonephila clavipes]|nr:transposable element Tc1 transposase [Trichonephila clavipes]